MDEKTAITKGFNAGYWLEKYEPELSKIIQDSFGNRNHPYAVGFIKGSREFTKEQLSVPFDTSQEQVSELEINDINKALNKEIEKPDLEK